MQSIFYKLREAVDIDQKEHFFFFNEKRHLFEKRVAKNPPFASLQKGQRSIVDPNIGLEYAQNIS